LANQSFTVGEVFRFSWGRIKSNFWLVVVVFTSTYLLSRGIYSVSESFGTTHVKTHFGTITHVRWFPISLLIYTILLSPISLATTKIALSICDGAKVRYSEVLSSLRLVPKFMLCDVIIALLLGSGVALMRVNQVLGILLGLVADFVCLRCLFWNYFIVDKELLPIAALRVSYLATKIDFWRLLGLAFISLIFMGLFWLITLIHNPLAKVVYIVCSSFMAAFVAIGTAFIYRRLLNNHA